VAAHGVPAGSILKETQSYDTVGNALFGLTTHAAPRALRSLAVVTSAFHMARTRAVFDVVFGLGGKALGGEGGGGGDGGATPSSSSSFFRLHYVAACDAGTASPAALAARAEREAASTRAWVEATAKFATLADLHAWVCALPGAVCHPPPVCRSCCRPVACVRGCAHERRVWLTKVGRPGRPGSSPGARSGGGSGDCGDGGDGGADLAVDVAPSPASQAQRRSLSVASRPPQPWQCGGVSPAAPRFLLPPRARRALWRAWAADSALRTAQPSQGATRSA
jgi:hypothetical protein